MDQSSVPIQPEPVHDAPWPWTLRAAIDRIIPPDDFPGAWDADAGAYILAQLAGQLREQAPTIEAGLAALDAEARHVFDRSFVALTTAEQDLLLAAIERDDVHAEWRVEPGAFFTVLVELTAEGYYGDPGNGGNRDEVAWRMIDYQTRVPNEQIPTRLDQPLNGSIAAEDR